MGWNLKIADLALIFGKNYKNEKIGEILSFFSKSEIILELQLFFQKCIYFHIFTNVFAITFCY